MTNAEYLDKLIAEGKALELSAKLTISAEIKQEVQHESA